MGASSAGVSGSKSVLIGIACDHLNPLGESSVVIAAVEIINGEARAQKAESAIGLATINSRHPVS